jgi:hypothetical protein
VLDSSKNVLMNEISNADILFNAVQLSAKKRRNAHDENQNVNPNMEDADILFNAVQSSAKKRRENVQDEQNADKKAYVVSKFDIGACRLGPKEVLPDIAGRSESDRYSHLLEHIKSNWVSDDNDNDVCDDANMKNLAANATDQQYDQQYDDYDASGGYEQEDEKPLKKHVARPSEVKDFIDQALLEVLNQGSYFELTQLALIGKKRALDILTLRNSGFVFIDLATQLVEEVGMRPKTVTTFIQRNLQNILTKL